MTQALRQHPGRNPQQQRLLQQAARELLLAQSSDWSFILRAGTTTELARDRIRRHLGRFWRLLEGLKPGGQVNSQWLQALEAEDALFPSIDPDDWQL